MALLAQAGDDEQRVVDAQRKPHRDDHVQDEQVERERLPDNRGDSERDDDRDDRHQHRNHHAEERPYHQQQNDQGRRQPELQLALAEVARGELLKVAVQRVAASDVRCESGAAVGVLDGRDQIGDSLVLRPGEDDWQHGGVTVRRHECVPAGTQVAGDLPYRSIAANLRSECSHARLEGGIRHDEAIRPQDDELVDRLLMRLMRKPRVDELLRRDRLRMISQARVRRQRRSQKRSDQTERHHDDRAPQGEHPSRVPCGDLGEPSRAEPGTRGGIRGGTGWFDVLVHDRHFLSKRHVGDNSRWGSPLVGAKLARASRPRTGKIARFRAAVEIQAVSPVRRASQKVTLWPVVQLEGERDGCLDTARWDPSHFSDDSRCGLQR